MENYSLSDLKAITEGNGFDGSNWILIILFFLIFGFGGFGGANNALTQQDALINSNFNNLAQNVQSISDRQYEQANNLTKGICELGYTVAQQTNGVQTNLGSMITTEGRGIQESLCDIKTAIHAEGEATRALMQADKIETLQNQINQLQLQNAMCGVVKYPNASTYYAGNNPFCGCNCSNI